MNIHVDLFRLGRTARVFLRLAADDHVSSTRLDHATTEIAGDHLEFKAKALARAGAGVRRKLRGRRFVLATLEEAAALQGFLDHAVRHLSYYDPTNGALSVERDLHRFARSLHLVNILEMQGEVA